MVIPGSCLRLQPRLWFFFFFFSADYPLQCKSYLSGYRAAGSLLQVAGGPPPTATITGLPKWTMASPDTMRGTDAVPLTVWRPKPEAMRMLSLLVLVWGKQTITDLSKHLIKLKIKISSGWDFGQGRWQMKCEENIKKIINKHLIKVISVWLDAQEASRETWALTLIDPRFLQKDDLAWHDPCYDMGCCSPLVIAIKLNQKYQKTDLGCNRHPRKGWPGMVHATTRDVDHPPKKWNVQCKQKHLIFSITPMLMCM